MNQKKFPMNTSKLLQEDKNVSKDENIASPLDKFELSPKKLQLRDILGSGAYGIVRLGTFQDDFGVVINVAVKGLKGIKIIYFIRNVSKIIYFIRKLI